MVHLAAILIELRAAIEAGGPWDQVEGWRLALRSTRLVPDAAEAEALADQLVVELSLLAVMHQMGGDTTYMKRDCHAIADEIERASRRH